MLLTTLPVLLTLPSTILSIVIFPDAHVFSSTDLQEAPEQSLLPKYASRPDTSDAVAAQVGKIDLEYCGHCYAAPSPPDAVKPGCCNTCAEVRKAYALVGWAFGHGRGVDQCEREGYGQLLEVQHHDGVPEYTSSSYPYQTETATAEDQDQQQGVLRPKYATFPQIVEEVL